MSAPGPAPPALSTERLTVRFDGKAVLRDVSIEIPLGRVVSIIGPAGSGKTTLLRSFNRMNELIPGAKTAGKVHFRGVDLYDVDIDPAEVRRRIGMVFQEATLFPKSVFDNVAFGLRAKGVEGDLHGLVEEALTVVGLWSGGAEVLDARALDLTAGEQRRLSIARALALKPDCLLLDEPTAALDPAASAKVESIIHALRHECTIVLATSDHTQAGRLSDLTAFLDSGRLMEYGATQELFTNPRNERTESYLTGRLP
ncbi:MAG: phosphate ABC transporter ATP-binding protein [Gemmatimonadota bacterium]|nr:phosphate ABC transporter ATP-binding protein [Gemmatimonadota bacterium]MDE2863808.1 phosphate ABC transporter ATP-binding protein [Gemmatimonadota bacterium]MXV94492.1 phosphate ABC transporter ATP-binding protein [Gemmatimonadota bacterium]MYE18149.1 phosphate ABC transporter ATP-binding protein [Gemmatimonadota bacterium]